ncbi:PC-Esterase [Dillenia turbinata]|uniref:PC-Esterase n=1 Tax=Dillenia turbinata TaxID=194707 RepID=A0AAN8Z819_9MAGN
MKSSPPSSQESKFKSFKRESHFINFKGLAPFLLASLFVTFIFSFFIFYSPIPSSVTTQRQQLNHADKVTPIKTPPRIGFVGDKECDLFKGHWVHEDRGSFYTNSSCTTIPESKNCFKNGREDVDFLNWRWKPDQCDLPRFEANKFLKIVRGKKMAFIGDSVSRNHMESLLCLLSQEEVPRDIYKDSEDRFRTWYFPSHDFTVMSLWTKFLVISEEREINGSMSGVFDLHLDKVDNSWSQKIRDTDYAIVSNGHWFFRKNYLYEDGRLLGCVYCNEPNVTELGLQFALRRAFRTALRHINECADCKDTVALVRTFSPAHFDGGNWDSGGQCNRTSPTSEGELRLEESFEWELRIIQVEEYENVGREVRDGKRFGTLDVTRAMLMRPDGHPNSNWGNKWMRGFNDCVHWCLPGPIDSWNEFLMALLENFAGFS